MCFVISCSNTTEPTQSDCGVIAFSIDDNDIYSINGDGSGFQKLANKPGSVQTCLVSKWCSNWL